MELIGSDGTGLGYDLLGCFHHSGTADGNRARVEGAGAERDDRRVALDYLDILERQLQHLSRDLGKARRVPLAMTVHPGEDGGSAIGMDDDPRTLVPRPPKTRHTHSK